MKSYLFFLFFLISCLNSEKEAIRKIGLSKIESEGYKIQVSRVATNQERLDSISYDLLNVSISKITDKNSEYQGTHFLIASGYFSFGNKVRNKSKPYPLETISQPVYWFYENTDNEDCLAAECLYLLQTNNEIKNRVIELVDSILINK